MTRAFRNFADLNSNLAYDVANALTGASVSQSNISESAYVEILVARDEEDATLKLRFSCHADRHGSDHTFRTDEDGIVFVNWTECGEPVEFDDDGTPVEFVTIERVGAETDCPKPAGERTFDHVEFPATRYAEIVAEAVALAHNFMMESV